MWAVISSYSIVETPFKLWSLGKFPNSLIFLVEHSYVWPCETKYQSLGGHRSASWLTSWCNESGILHSCQGPLHGDQSANMTPKLRMVQNPMKAVEIIRGNKPGARERTGLYVEWDLVTYKGPGALPKRSAGIMICNGQQGNSNLSPTNSKQNLRSQK